MIRRRALLLTLMLLPLAGCQLQPLYGGGSQGVVRTALRSVTIAPIPDRAGWLVRQALIDRIGDAGSGATYRLEVQLDDQIDGFGVRADDSITRERRSLRARYRLVDASNGGVVLDATAGSDAGIDVVRSEYAVLAAENSALERLSQEVAEQIIIRLALYARQTETK